MLIYANPSNPARRRKPKKGATMARKTRKRRAVSRRRVHRNPSAPKRHRRSYRMHHNPVKRRRRVHRNPSFAKGILGELASMNGVVLIASAVAAPAVANMAMRAVPATLQEGYAGLATKAIIIGAGAWALDRFAKSRHAALGFAIGGLGTVVNDAINVIRTRQALPATVPPAVSDEIAKNPSAFNALMAGNWNSLNGYEVAPMGGYDVAPMGESFDSLN